MDGSDVPSVSTFLGDSGACPEIAFNGKVWRIGHPVQRVRTCLEELIAGKAISEIMAFRGSPAYGELFGELTSRISAGEYRTWGVGWQRIFLNGFNGHLFLLALLREHHKDATETEARALALGEPEQVQAALVRAVPGFLSILLDGLPFTVEQRAVAQEALMQAFQGPPKPPTAATSET